MLPTTNIPDAVWIAGKLYCKTPESSSMALEVFSSDFFIDPGVDCDWYARPKTTSIAICMSCNRELDILDARRHGNKCACGEVTCLEVVDGSLVRIVFASNYEAQLQMRSHHWDAISNTFYLHPDPLSSPDRKIADIHRAKSLIQRNKSIFTEVTIDNKQYLAMRVTSNVFVLDADRYVNFSVHFSNLQPFEIFEAWRWAPLPVSINLPARIIYAGNQIPEIDWYYPDDPDWPEDSFEAMGEFVRHFVPQLADEWERQSCGFRHDAPGAIEDITNFCNRRLVTI